MLHKLLTFKWNVELLKVSILLQMVGKIRMDDWDVFLSTDTKNGRSVSCQVLCLSLWLARSRTPRWIWRIASSCQLTRRAVLVGTISSRYVRSSQSLWVLVRPGDDINRRLRNFHLTCDLSNWSHSSRLHLFDLLGTVPQRQLLSRSRVGDRSLHWCKLFSEDYLHHQASAHPYI